MTGNSSAGQARVRPFQALDWALVAIAAPMWGSSFLLIKIGVQDVPPTTVAWLRLAFGAAALALIPAARKPLRRPRDWGQVGVLGAVWMAVPFVLFPLGEQTIPSALAGMINGAAPIFTAAIGALWFRNRLSPRLAAGLVVGFLGVVVVTLPAAGGPAALMGVLLVGLATLLYGVAFNIADPVEERNGPLPVIWRVEIVALVLTTPTGVIGLADSTPTLVGVIALVVLGAVSTGFAFACFAVLIGRVGATRASVTVYLVPVVAVLLGAGLADETVSPLSLLGIGLVLLGAYLASGHRGPVAALARLVRWRRGRRTDGARSSEADASGDVTGEAPES